MYAFALVLAVSAVTLGCATQPRGATGETASGVDDDAAAPTPWRQRRAQPAHIVEGQRSTPSPLLLDDTMERAHYLSRDGELLAVIARPPSLPRTADTPVERQPGVVLVHDGTALRQETLAWAGPFVAAGFVVLMPSLRGENGNPGQRELLRGELDDLKAAARFLAEEPDVDVDRLYAFGHEEGGGLVALLALDDDQPFQRLATSNGVYGATTFLRWRAEDPHKVPFDVASLDERTVRALVPNAGEMVRPLVIYAGDPASVGHAATVKARSPTLVDVVILGEPAITSGSALPEALRRFHALIVKDAFPAAAAEPVSLRAQPAPASRSAP